jgi:type IV secretory pathway VirB10-like protein
MTSDVDGGSWMGHVNTDVFNQINPSEVLLPAYATIFGVNDAKADTNQQALLTPRATLIQLPPSTSYPRGAFLPINVGAQDDLGTQSVSGEVNYHRWQRYGSAALLALINTGAQIGGYMGHSSGYFYSPTQAAAQSFGSSTNEVIGQELRRVLNIRPTITVPLGQTFIVRSIKCKSSAYQQ